MTAAPSPRRKLGWLVYAALLTAAVVVGELTRGTAPDLVAVASWVFTAVLLVALWCYAWQRPLGEEGYWRAVFWVVVFAAVLMLIPVLMAGGELARFTIALTLPTVPAYVAMYLYAYRSPALWGREG